MPRTHVSRLATGQLEVLVELGGATIWVRESGEDPVDVSGVFGDLVALGLLLEASRQPTPPVPGTPVGPTPSSLDTRPRVVAAALEVHGDPDTISVTALRLGTDNPGGELIELTDALALAAAGIAEIVDPPPPEGLDPAPLGV